MHPCRCLPACTTSQVHHLPCIPAEACLPVRCPRCTSCTLGSPGSSPASPAAPAQPAAAHCVLDQRLTSSHVQVVPLYNAECAPPKWRGAKTLLFQLWVTIGIFAAGREPSTAGPELPCRRASQLLLQLKHLLTTGCASRADQLRERLHPCLVVAPSSGPGRCCLVSQATFVYCTSACVCAAPRHVPLRATAKLCAVRHGATDLQL